MPFPVQRERGGRCENVHGGGRGFDGHQPVGEAAAGVDDGERQPGAVGGIVLEVDVVHLNVPISRLLPFTADT